MQTERTNDRVDHGTRREGVPEREAQVYESAGSALGEDAGTRRGSA